MRPPETPEDLITLAGQARDLIRGRLHAGVPPGRVETLVRAHLPAAWDHFDHRALVALTRRPPDGGCAWDAAFLLAVADQAPEPLTTAANKALLGEQCPTCRRRRMIDVARVKAQAARTTTAAAAWQHTRRLAATGVLWTTPGREPAEVTALVAAATRWHAPGTHGTREVG